jgi:hypothetical protein
MGSAIGVFAYIWGQSAWTGFLFSVAFGASLTLASVILLALLFFVGRFHTGRRARFARNDLANIGPWVMRRLQRGLSLLLGLALIALVSWAFTGSERGLALVLLCGWFAAPLLWCAYGLREMLISQRSAA